MLLRDFDGLAADDQDRVILIVRARYEAHPTE
jgi:hypothetical protein